MLCELLPISEFPRLLSAWDAINDQHYQHPLLESRFVSQALRHLGTGQEKVAICGAPANPDALAIVVQRRFGSWSTFQPSQAPLGALIVKPGTDLGLLSKALFTQMPKSCQVLSLTQQDPDIVPRPVVQPALRVLEYIDTARISVDGTFEEYWSARGRNLRHNIKRQRNRLEREGVSLRLEMLARPDEMRDGVRAYGDLESRGWKAAGGTAIHLDNEQGRFYAALLEDYASTGNARIYRYFYNDQLSAVDLCLCNDSAFIILKTTYDESVQASSPALLMRREYFPAIFDKRETRRIEFYGKVMDWHTKWSDEIRGLYHINAYRHAFFARLHNRG